MSSAVTASLTRTLAILAGCVALSFPAAAQTNPNVCTIALPAPTYTPAAISINSSHQWVLNGSTWIPRGVGIKAFIASAAYLQGQTSAGDVAEYKAQLAYGANEMQAIRAFGADTVRYQVSQYSLSHDANGKPSVTGNAAFVSCLKTAVRIARNHNLIVILAVQSEQDGLVGDHTARPKADTATALHVLNSLYKGNQGIVYELYNEPGRANWLDWKCGSKQGAINAYGSAAYYNSCISSSPKTPASGLPANSTAVGEQVLVDGLRADGSTNVIIADAGSTALTLNGIKTSTGNFFLNDPSNTSVAQIAYALHPYPGGKDRTACYPTYFGLNTTLKPPVPLNVPVLVTEWSAETGAPKARGPMLRGLDTIHPAVGLVNFVNRYEYPMVAGAFDIAGILTQKVPAYNAPVSSWVPTNYNHFFDTDSSTGKLHYKEGGDNAGLLLNAFFEVNGAHEGHAQAFSCADAVSQGDNSCSKMPTAPPSPPCS